MLYFSRKYSHVNARANVLLYVTWDNKEEKNGICSRSTFR